jgi:hypothetical protein
MSGENRFWVTNRVANPILRPLLRGPLGGRLGGRLAVLRYRGRRSGQIHELVVQFVRDGDQVWIVPGQPERKRWWRNMQEPQPVEVWLAGEEVRGVARVIRGPDEQADVNEAVVAYRKVFPRTNNPAVIIRVDLGDNGSA